MKIAQVPPLIESVPPAGYGGTERVVHYLTEELVRLGHEVTLFASGDSRTSAQLEACAEEALRLGGIVDYVPHHFVMLERLFRRIDEFDIVHFHVDYLHYPFSRRYREPHITTLHGRLDLPGLIPLYREYPDMPVVSVSDAQRKPLPWLNWQATVHHGMPLDLLQPCESHDSYLAFLGRVSPEKGLEKAIAIAEAAGLELRIAAKVDRDDRGYYEDVIVPLLDKPCVNFIGEIGDEDKNEFLGRAQALLFPIQWDEPFGMVMMEAMACGTPVIAFPGGSVPEVQQHGVTGYVVRDIEEAVQAVAQTRTFDRRRCRQAFEERFSAARMARDYVACYEQVLGHDQAHDGRGNENSGLRAL
jgi:glycosyltransferase involved in cell wall biosynthesis